LTVAGGTVICARCHEWNNAIGDLSFALASGEPHGHCHEHGDAAGCEDRDFHRDFRCALWQAVWETLTTKNKSFSDLLPKGWRVFAFVTKPHEKHQNEITALLD
jgi:hypothetical protein